MVSVFIGLVCLRYHDATPEATIQSVVDSLNRQDWKGVFSRFELAKVDEASAVATKLIKQDPNFPKFAVKLKAPVITGDDAKVPVSIGMSGKAAGDNEPFRDEVICLHQVAGDWKVVEGGSAVGFFSEFGRLARDPQVFARQSASASSRTVILSKMKQIALAVLMFANDHDDKYALNQASFKAKLNPYIRNDKIWLGPDGKMLDIRLNPFLVGKNSTSIAEPARCVLLTLGPKSKLVYDTDVTPIAFVDGHVKLLKKEAIPTLKWK